MKTFTKSKNLSIKNTNKKIKNLTKSKAVGDLKSLLPGNFEFFNTVTVGQRGQIVIPADIRKAMDIKVGQKLMIFVKMRKVAAIFKMDDLEDMLVEFTRHLSSFTNKKNKF
ncbi:AbrB/MazE/SpoVT family DNA-binding domain-containing protein [Patescibacteria group bacterium]|nr:AbrB/MazE/SpoVT family DNA-binding domain-containing protein [Patescibacteria group bacterium]